MLSKDSLRTGKEACPASTARPEHVERPFWAHFVQTLWPRCARVFGRKPFIPNGPPGSIDAGEIWTGRAPVVIDNELRFYYCVGDQLHGIIGRSGPICLAKLRLDGFVSMDAETKGTLLTKPFFLDENQLFVNAESQQGELKAEVVDYETNDILPDLSLADCDPVRVDDTSIRITWNHSGLPVIKTPVRLRFEMSNTKLYAFWLSK